jgi:hypothetical protein
MVVERRGGGGGQGRWDDGLVWTVAAMEAKALRMKEDLSLTAVGARGAVGDQRCEVVR